MGSMHDQHGRAWDADIELGVALVTGPQGSAVYQLSNRAPFPELTRSMVEQLGGFRPPYRSSAKRRRRKRGSKRLL